MRIHHVASRAAALVLAALSAAGCTSSAMLAPSTLPLSDKQYVRLGNERVTERALGFMFLFIPIGGRDPAYRALEDLKEEYDADALIEVSVTVSHMSVIVFTWVWTTVSGIPVDVAE